MAVPFAMTAACTPKEPEASGKATLYFVFPTPPCEWHGYAVLSSGLLLRRGVLTFSGLVLWPYSTPEQSHNAST